MKYHIVCVKRTSLIKRKWTAFIQENDTQSLLDCYNVTTFKCFIIVK